MPARDDDTVRIGTHPGLVNLRFIVLSAGTIGALLGSVASIPFDALGAGELSWPLGVLSVWLLFTTGLLLGVTLAYDVVEWSPSAHTVSLRRHALSLRRRTVPINTITEARRSLSSASNGADYVVYRFTSTLGATSRVLVKGTPMKGLDAPDLRRLAAFVSELQLEVPDAAAPAARAGSRDARGHVGDGIPPLTDRQLAAAVSRTTGGGSSRVGRDTLLEELDTLIRAAELRDPQGDVSPNDPTASTAHGKAGRAELPARAKDRRPFGGIRSLIAMIRSERFDRECLDDDAEALEVLAANPSPTARLRGVLMRALVGCIAAGLLVIAVAVVLEVVGARLLGSEANDVVALLVLCAMLLSFVLYLGWCAAADADVRHRRKLARSWMARRDDGERERGLAEPFVAAWEAQELRLRVAGAAIVIMIGSTAIVAAVIVFVTTTLPLLTSVGIFVSGAALTGAGIALFVGITRRRRADAEELVYLGGLRLLPPARQE